MQSRSLRSTHAPALALLASLSLISCKETCLPVEENDPDPVVYYECNEDSVCVRRGNGIDPTITQSRREEAGALLEASGISLEGLSIEAYGRDQYGQRVQCGIVRKGLPFFGFQALYLFESDGRLKYADVPDVREELLPDSTWRVDMTYAACGFLESMTPYEVELYGGGRCVEAALGYYQVRRVGNDIVYALAWRLTFESDDPREREQRYPVAYVDAKSGKLLEFDAGIRTTGVE